MTIEVAGMTPLIQVYDMNEALAFYRDVLGFRVSSDSGTVDTPEGRHFHWCSLQLGSVSLMLNSAYDEGERPAGRDAARQAAHADTGLFFDCADPNAVAAALQANGIATGEPRDAPYGMRQLYVTDPDGYQLCFQTMART
jgi:glyoxylase I family protein